VPYNEYLLLKLWNVLCIGNQVSYNNLKTVREEEYMNLRDLYLMDKGKGKIVPVLKYHAT